MGYPGDEQCSMFQMFFLHQMGMPAIVVLFISLGTVVVIMMDVGVGLDMGLVILTLSIFYSSIPRVLFLHQSIQKDSFFAKTECIQLVISSSLITIGSW